MKDNNMQKIERMTVPLIPVDVPGEAEVWPPVPGSIAALHFERSEVPGHIRAYVDGKWWLVPAIAILNACSMLCPYENKPPHGPVGPNLRPVRN